MGILREVEAIDGHAAIKVAALYEVTQADGTSWLYYTVGADLAAKIDLYTQHGYTVGDPETVLGMYQSGFPVHRRPIVKKGLGPNQEQATADADGENEFPRFMANAPVCYTRKADGQEWLVYSRGEHMRQAIDELWRLGKAVVRLEVPCTDENGAPILFQGKRCYRRLVVPSDHKYAQKPDDIK
jgi:hypothetical protein